uniref:CSON012364 protein n=1 Tax=Culicoides sonorensis TaxID=179676 RepID=A0A336KM84_CULSO
MTLLLKKIYNFNSGLLKNVKRSSFVFNFTTNGFGALDPLNLCGNFSTDFVVVLIVVVAFVVVVLALTAGLIVAKLLFLNSIFALFGKTTFGPCKQEWLNMAANFSGLPAAAPSPSSISNTINNNNNINNSAKPASPCSCSNISIMQLFHEMKQEYPTVPDHVVTQLVAENCHNRPRCIEKLNEIEEEYAWSSQAYPVQSIRNNKPPTPPRRCKNTQRQLEQEKHKEIRKQNNNNHNSENEIEVKSDDVNKVILKKSDKLNMCKFENNNNNKTVNNHNNETLVFNRPAPQRPNTLSLNKIESNNTLRPIRSAPPPPISAGMTVLSSNPVSTPESLNVSLNVTVSPGSGRPPVIRPQRHISEVTVQPEMPYSPPPVPHNGARSYTSVNFTLRPPSTLGVQSPIDISAGPSLTYSSSSYDARQGYQSSLQITVGGTGTPGVFSAMRTRAQQIQENNCNLSSSNNNVNDDENLNERQGDNRMVVEEYCDADEMGYGCGNDYQHQYYQPIRPSPNNSTRHNQMQVSSKGCHLMTSSFREDEIVQRQLQRKGALEKELSRDKSHLEIMQFDISVLQLSFSVSDIERLTEEIKQLRNECKMYSEILDKAGVPVLGDLTNNVNALSISDNSNISTRTPKRPPLPAALRTVTSPQRALQMPAFTNLNEINLRHHTNTTPTGFNADDYRISSNMESSWTCGICTFQNHPLLNKCEQCEQPRNPSGTIQITAAHFEPRFENVQYQQQANTNNNDHVYANARSLSMTNEPNSINNNKNDVLTNDTMVPQSAPPNLKNENPPNFNPTFNCNSPIVSSLEELQFENVVQLQGITGNMSTSSHNENIHILLSTVVGRKIVHSWMDFKEKDFEIIHCWKFQKNKNYEPGKNSSMDINQPIHELMN